MSKQSAKSFWSIYSFWLYISQHKLRLFLVSLIFIISNIFLAIIPLLIGGLVGALDQGQPPWTYVILLIAMSILHDGTWQIANLAYRNYMLPFSFHYETLLFQKVINNDYHYFTDKFTGKLSSHIGTIHQGLRDLISQVYFSYTSLVISMVGVALVLVTVNWQTVLLFFVCLAFQFIIGSFTVHRMVQTERAETDMKSTKHGHIVDSIGNFSSVKSFYREIAELGHLQVQQEKTLSAAIKAFNWGIIFWWSQSIIVRWLFWPVAIAMNVAFYLDGAINLGQLATLLSAALIFTNVIWEVIWQFSQFSLQVARIEEAHTYLFGKKVVRVSDAHNTAITTPKLHQDIVIEDLHFAYPNKLNTIVLDNISFTVPHGQKVGIVGKSGSGKTTLTKILLGFYEQSKGSIIVDGEKISSKAFAQLVSYVPQDTALFHRSIADNIAYGATHTVSREEIIRAAKMAYADEFIRDIDGDYEALVGERGVKLSGGQRQRIAIARAILKDSPILILDEATSALDSESEVLVQEALEKLWRTKTAIVIAHRLSTISKLDRIIVLENGRIIEDGTHEELLKNNSTYARLWAHQSGGFIE